MQTRRMLPTVIVLATAAAIGFAQDAPQTGKSAGVAKSATPNRATLEQEFARKLSGAALVGSFTVDGQPADKPANQERYELESVSKARGDDWTFVSRIKFGAHDVKIPLTLKVHWAGDTPMISLTDLEIPGLGTFTARVMFHGDRYAGTWQHGDVGGHMFGRIERAKPVSAKPAVKK